MGEIDDGRIRKDMLCVVVVKDEGKWMVDQKDQHRRVYVLEYFFIQKMEQPRPFLQLQDQQQQEGVLYQRMNGGSL